MSEQTGSMEKPAAAYPVPRGAYEIFLFVAALGFLLLTGFTYAYGKYGAQINDGLDAACAEASFQSGRKFEALSNYEGALQRYRQAMEGQFRSEEQRLMCGRAIGDILQQQHRYAEAIAAYEELPEAAFDTPGAYTGFVTALWRGGRLAEARKQGQRWLAAAERAENLDQQAWAHHALMRIAEEEGRLDTALAHGEEMLRLKPDSDAHMHLVRVLRAMNRPAEAKKHVEAYLKTGDDPKLLEEAEGLLPILTQAAEQPKE